MRSKKLGVALVTIFVLGAALTSSALAAAVTEDVQWYTGSSPGTLLTGFESVTSSGSGELITEIGTTKLRMKATGLECLECTIKNEGGRAVSEGRRKFTGVTVIEPATCAVEGGTVTSLPLRLTPDYMIGSSSYVKIEPASGTTFATIKLIKGSGSCAISGTYSTTGTLFAKNNNATNVFAINQEGVSSGAINAEAGGELKFGSKKAEINGTASFALSGVKKGIAFATH